MRRSTNPSSLAAALVACDRGARGLRTRSRCSTSPTIRRGSCTRTSTRAFAKSLAGEDRAGGHRSISRTAAPASRPAPSSTASRPTSSRSALAYDVDALSRIGQAHSGRLAEAAAEQLDAVHVDDRVRWSARAIRSACKRLGRPGAARHLGRDAEPEDLRRRTVELPGGLGLREAEVGRRRRRRRTSSRSCYRMCRCSTPARAARRPPSSSAASAMC